MNSSQTPDWHTEALDRWLEQHIAGFGGPAQLTLIAGGQSNPTYLMETPSRRYIMRCKPGPVSRLLPSAHAIEREFRVLKALTVTNVPVALPLALCEDEGVIGRAFYVMEHVDGQVLWDQALPEMSPDQRRRTYRAMNETLCKLHLVNPHSVGLGDFGKPGNYFERQISRWTKQYQQSITQPIPEMDSLIQWLPDHIPDSARSAELISIVHGDYRLDNLMFSRSEPRVLAVLDWELSTLGHPLADFSYHCMSWHIEPGEFRGIAGLDHASLGIPSEREYIDWYCEATGFIQPDALLADWNFYLSYNLFRIAAILQGIAKRVENGTASHPQALRSAAGARPLAEKAWQYAQRHQTH